MAEDKKAELRKTLKADRHALDSEKVAALSQSIANRCLDSVDWAQVKSLHSYVPIADLHEVDTGPLIKAIWDRWPQIHVAVPRLANDRQMESVIVDAGTHWKEHIHGMPEPINGYVFPADHQFDVIIVPTLAFDSHGYRLGYGGGFYDKFLAAQPNAITIGLCYHQGHIAAGLPHEPHDIPLKRIITESGVVTSYAKPHTES